jgi:hypothetical protein
MFVTNLSARNIALPADIKMLTNRLFRSFPSLSLLTISAACRSIISVHTLTSVLEQCIASHIDHLSANAIQIPERNSNSESKSPSPPSPLALSSLVGNYWDKLATVLQLPELSYNEFVVAASELGNMLTLHATASQRIRVALSLAQPPSASRPGAKPHPPSLTNPLFGVQSQVDLLLAWTAAVKIKPYDEATHGDAKDSSPTSPSAAVSSSSVSAFASVPFFSVLYPSVSADSKESKDSKGAPMPSDSFPLASPLPVRNCERYHEGWTLFSAWRTLLFWQTQIVRAGTR